MLLRIHPDNPEERKLQQVINCLKDGGIIIYPTDTVYGIGCDIHNAKAVERVCRLKGIDPQKSNLSFVCHDLSHLSQYTLNFDKAIYRLMKTNLPEVHLYFAGKQRSTKVVYFQEKNGGHSRSRQPSGAAVG